MPLKDGSGNAYKIFKGAAKPVNLYINGEQLAGYTEQTLRGEVINFENTYEDKFSSIQICGGFSQEGITEPKAESLSRVEPTFASDYEVTFKEGTIEIPKVIVLDDGTEVDVELKGIRNIEGDTSYYDYIEVIDESVKLYKVIKALDVTELNFVFHSDKPSADAISCYFLTHNTIGTNKFNAQNGLCNFLKINTFSATSGNSYKTPYAFALEAGRIYFSVKYDDIGVTSDATNEEKLAGFKNWLKQMSDAGTPVTIWYASTSPTITDITNSDIGRELLNLRTHYKNTNIAATADGAIPTVCATAKVAYCGEGTKHENTEANEEE